MPRCALLIATTALLVLTASARAQFGEVAVPKGSAPVHKLPRAFARLADVTVEVVPAKAKWGETVNVKLTLVPKPAAKAYTYPAFPADPTQLSTNTVVLPPPGDLIFIGGVSDPKVQWKEKPRADSVAVDQYTEGPLTWEFKAVVSPKSMAGPKSVPFIGVSLQVCDARNCFRVSDDELPPIEFRVEEGASDRVNLADLAAALAVLKVQPITPATAPGGPSRATAPPAPEVPPSGPKSATRKVAKPLDAYKSELKAIAENIVAAESATDSAGGAGEKSQTGLWAFIATAALWGLISLVTP